MFENRLNSLRWSNRYLLCKQIPFGYGAQLSIRINAFKLGLATGRKVIFEYENDPPYTTVFEKDFFLHGFDAYDLNGVEYIDDIHSEDECLIYDVYKVRRGIIKECELMITDMYKGEGRFISASCISGEIFRWFKLNEDVKLKIVNDVKRLGIDSTVLGVHYRRGDKTVETPYVSKYRYNQSISKIAETGGFEKVFIASDSVQASIDIIVPSGLSGIFDKDEVRYNNANHRMLIANPSLANQETYTSIKNVYLLSLCGGIIGQDNAHFSLIASSVVSSNGYSNVELLDGFVGLKESRLLRFYYSSKKKIRSGLRVVLPFLKSENLARKTK